MSIRVSFFRISFYGGYSAPGFNSAAFFFLQDAPRCSSVQSRPPLSLIIRGRTTHILVSFCEPSLDSTAGFSQIAQNEWSAVDRCAMLATSARSHIAGKAEQTSKETTKRSSALGQPRAHGQSCFSRLSTNPSKLPASRDRRYSASLPSRTSLSIELTTSSTFVSRYEYHHQRGTPSLGISC